MCVTRQPFAVGGLPRGAPSLLECPRPKAVNPRRRRTGAGSPAARWQAAAAGRLCAAGQTPNRPTAPRPPQRDCVVKRDDLTRNLAQLKISCTFAAESARKGRGKVLLNSILTMATMQGITGKLSGKMGSAVFRVREGQQIVAQYNPIVKNPNTEGQQSQRAKFKLVSQLAAVMAPAMGSFIIKTRAEGGKPSQRNAFTKANFPLVEVTTDAQEVVAKIPMEQLQLTSSFRNLPQMNVSAGQGSFDVDFSGIASDVSVIRLVVVGYDNNVASVVRISDNPIPSGSAGSLSIAVENLPQGNYTALAYGLIPSESVKSSINLDNIHTPADEDFISAVELNAMVAAGQMSETRTVGANVTVI